MKTFYNNSGVQFKYIGYMPNWILKKKEKKKGFIPNETAPTVKSTIQRYCRGFPPK